MRGLFRPSTLPPEPDRHLSVISAREANVSPAQLGPQAKAAQDNGTGFRQGTAARWETGPPVGWGKARTQGASRETSRQGDASSRTPAVDSRHVSGTSHFPWGTFVSKGQSHPTPTLKGSEDMSKRKGDGRMAQNEGAF